LKAPLLAARLSTSVTLLAHRSWAASNSVERRLYSWTRALSVMHDTNPFHAVESKENLVDVGGYATAVLARKGE
jgi:hypothetical protein